MSDTNAPKHPTFHVHNCPQKLIDRANAKAALKGKGVSEWVVEVLERETKKLRSIQDEYNAEDDK
jgi:hypothetical protein